jgi:glycosyltransferase involved in cell wall biosynthesis
LAQAIESVCAQEYSCEELIIVDAGSTDNTREVVTVYPKVRFFVREGMGLAEARNFGASQARGELIAFIDSDDIWLPNKLRLQVDYLRTHPEVQFVIGKFKYFLEPGCAVPPNFKKNLLEGSYVGYLPEILLVRKSFFEATSGFDAKYKIGNDTDWFVRAKDMYTPMGIIPEVLLHKRVHNSNTSVENVKFNNHEILMIFRESVKRQKQAQKKVAE